MNNWIEKVKGPVIPLPVPFTAEHEVDYTAMENYVDFLASAGIPNVMTTVGTSRYNLLSWEEMKLVNEAVVRGADKRALTIVANPTTGGVKTAIDFAQHAERIGADLFLLFFPERDYGEENTYEFFKEVAASTNIGILIHEMPMRNGLGGGAKQYSIDLLNRLLDIDNIVGLKEEALDKDYSNEILKAVVHKSVIIGAGGGMSRYLLRDFDLGAKAFLGGIGNFEPALELEFYQAITSGDRARAEEIVNTIELPYFEQVVPMGWHPSLKGALALKGLLPSYERPPMKQLPESEVNTLRTVLQNNGWL